MQGFVQVYTGDGKGKTTAALGLALRAAGAGLKVYIGQFVKNADYNELRALQRLTDCITIVQFGRGCFLLTEPCQADIDAAHTALATIGDVLESCTFDLVVADEINVAFALGLISENDLLALMARRPKTVELVFTGRGAPPSVLARADLVTEMRSIKHYYDQGVLARKGIEN